MRLVARRMERADRHISQAASFALCRLRWTSCLTGYRDSKRAAAVLDFDDLLLHVRAPWSAVRTTCGKPSERRYKFILIDEFQDTDQIQNEILFSIAAIP